MSSIIPYSTQGKRLNLKQNAVNFPGLKLQLSCNEATGAMVLVDDITGLVIADSTGAMTITNNGDGTLTFGSAFDSISGGALASPGTKKLILVYIGKPSSTGNVLVFGTTTANGIRAFSTAAGVPLIASNSVVVNGTAGLVGDGVTLQGRVVVADWGNNLNSYDFDGTTYTVRAPAALAATGITAIDNICTVGFQARPSLIQLWHFTTLPSAAEIKSMLTWTLGNLSASPYDKAAYPGWRGRV